MIETLKICMSWCNEKLRLKYKREKYSHLKFLFKEIKVLMKNNQENVLEKLIVRLTGTIMFY